MIGSETVPVRGVIVFARGIPVPFVDIEQWADRWLIARSRRRPSRLNPMAKEIILTNDRAGDPNIRHRRTIAPKQQQ